MSTDQVALVVTTVVTLVGLYFANSLRLRTRAEVESDVASKRFDAYAALRATIASASPMRDAPLTKAERVRLFDDFTRWYFEGGHGMLLTEQSRNIYLTAKRNLTCPDDELVPDALATRVKTGGEAVLGDACKKQLSLLRSSLRADIRIYTDPYDESPSHEDVAFLKACKVKLDQQPWKRALRVDMVAAQLARNHAQFEQAVGDEDAVRRTRLARQLVLDTRFFIPAYGAVFAASCVLLGLRDFAAAIPLAVFAALLAAAGIAFDLAENRRTYVALGRRPTDEATLAGADAGARATRRASLAKWLCLSSTTALLSASFLAEGDWWYAVGGAYLAAGAAGVAAVLANLGASTRSGVVRLAFLALCVANAAGLGLGIALAAQ
jgi:hypothetical protein